MRNDVTITERGETIWTKEGKQPKTRRTDEQSQMRSAAPTVW